MLALVSLPFLGEALAIGPRDPPAFVALLWATVSAQLVAAAYLGGEPGLFGKRADGRLPLARVVLLLPYFLVAWAIRDFAPLATREPAWSQVADGLWVGRYVRSYAALPEGVGCVVDLAAESPAIAGLPDSVEYVSVPTLDGSAPPEQVLERLVGGLAESPAALYVHCAAGHGRSALVVAALLVARGEAQGPDDALARLSRIRPRVSLNADQRRALDELCGRLARERVDDRAAP